MVGRIKRSRPTLQWFGYLERMEIGRLVKKLYMSDVERSRRLGQLRMRWENKVQAYMIEDGFGWDEGVVVAIEIDSSGGLFVETSRGNLYMVSGFR